MNLKSFSVVLCSLVLFFSCATTIPTLERQQSIGKTKEFPDLNKTELYNRSLSWVARTYNSANDVIQLKYPESGQIICKGLGSAAFDFGFKRYFRYTMIIDIKDGKIRTRYENIQSEAVGQVAGPDMDIQWETVQNYFKTLNEELFAGITTAEKDKNW
jgi:hypothetical protein